MGSDPKFTEKLIRAVKMNPILYDVTELDYKNSFQKKLVWQAIAKDIGGKNGEVISWKWKNLRDSYAKHRKSSGVASEEMTHKLVNWRWAPYMTFLDPFLRRPKELLDYKADETQEDQSADETDSKYVVPEISPVRRESEEQDSSSSGYYSTSKSSDKKRRLIEHEEVPIEPYQVENTSDGLDKIDYLFLNYAETFKRLSPRRQVLMKLKMAEIFAKAELQEIERDPIKYENADSE